MGPRSFDRGELRRTPRPRSASYDFNGAAIFRPRRARSCWRTARTSWPDFNGAAIFRPRRVHGLIAVGCLQFRTSMGPRSFDRGEKVVTVSLNAHIPALQWGRDLSTAESSCCQRARRATARLQWGRDLSTAESGSRRAGSVAGKDHFNGAAIFRPRRAGAMGRGVQGLFRLQWGRDLSTAESSAATAGRSTDCP